MFDWVDNWKEKLQDTHLNAFQTISATGIFASLMAHAGIWLFEKDIERFWAVYLVWTVVFILATISRYYDEEEEH